MNNVNENIKKQVLINKLYSGRIKNITRIINAIQQFLKEENNTNMTENRNIQFKLNSIGEEFKNIDHATLGETGYC